MSDQYVTPPVLLLLFNRPDLARAVFKEVRAAKPSKLFIAVDGPRYGVLSDVERCRESRELVSKIDWPCKVETLFRTENLGCKVAVSNAISWFFQHVESGVILEEDCVPCPFFFRFADRMLEIYGNDQRVVSVCGFNPISGYCPSNGFGFSQYNLLWGWATWRDRWARYSGGSAQFDILDKAGGIDALFSKNEVIVHWSREINKLRSSGVDSWGYHWMLSCWLSGGLTVVPAWNLIHNIGFDGRGTHFKTLSAPSYPAVRQEEWTLLPTQYVFKDCRLDKQIEAQRFGIFPVYGRLQRVALRIERILSKFV